MESVWCLGLCTVHPTSECASIMIVLASVKSVMREMPQPAQCSWTHITYIDATYDFDGPFRKDRRRTRWIELDAEILCRVMPEEGPSRHSELLRRKAYRTQRVQLFSLSSTMWQRRRLQIQKSAGFTLSKSNSCSLFRACASGRCLALELMGTAAGKILYINQLLAVYLGALSVITLFNMSLVCFN